MSDQNQILGHSEECDGIDEYDNKLPAWWLGIFYFTIAFALVFVPYLSMTGWSSAGQYQEEMAAAKEKWPEPSGELALVASPEAIAKGKAVYETTCVGCHGADLKGGIGPNLTDATWIHGGALKDIANTVANGVLDKGMPAWGPILGPQKVADVAAFVHSSGGGQ
jgi:cytochrome c oxidase cbb3-type subunit 3